jgi:hypothetical protein
MLSAEKDIFKKKMAEIDEADDCMYSEQEIMNAILPSFRYGVAQVARDARKRGGQVDEYDDDEEDNDDYCGWVHGGRYSNNVILCSNNVILCSFSL